MIIELFFVIFLVFLTSCCHEAAFTCQGTSYSAALSSCPDGGAQKVSSGGNVTIRVIRAVNLLNKDFSGPAAGVSDPYVRFSAGNVSVRTRTIRNTLNPHWHDEYVSLGFLGSATLITVEMWDADSGLEFNDDLIARTTFRVPFCSTFTANTSTVKCADPFQCSSDDSMWHSPTRKHCNESGFVNFFPSKASCASGRGTCLYFEVNIVPFQISVDYTYPNALYKKPVVGALGTITSASWTSTFSLPFIDVTMYLDPSAAASANMKGALMLRSSNADKSYGAYNAIKYYASVNFPAKIYLCRFSADNSGGIPEWMSNDFSSRYLRIYRLLIRSTTKYFDCFVRDDPGTVKNQWGGVVSDPMTFRTNTLPGLDGNTVSEQNSYTYNYIVLAVPEVVAKREEDVTIVYDMSAFMTFFGSYGLVWCWFMFLVVRFLYKIGFRLDRLSNFLVSRVLTGEDRNLIATLFLCNHDSPSNVEFRSHLYHARNILLFLIFLPFFLLISWGMSCAAQVRPRALGIGLTFIGSSLIFLWYAFKLWQRSQWRLSAMTVASFYASLICFVLFMIIALFVDPAVLHYDAHVDMAGLSLVFGTINCIPLIMLIFKQDRSQKLYLELVIRKLSDALQAFKSPAGTTSNTTPVISPTKELQINRLLHGLLGEKYTINPKLPALRYAAVLEDCKPSFNSVQTATAAPASATIVGGTKTVKEGETEQNDEQQGEEEEGLIARLLTEERKLYAFSIAILLIYLIIAATTTASPSLAFLNICYMVLLDCLHLCMSKGDNAWSPGFKCMLLILGRLLVCGSPLSLWILNYSTCYIVYALALLHEAMQAYLPLISSRRAGEIVFGGLDASSLNILKDLLQTEDMAGGPAFALGLLSAFFAAAIIIASFMADASSIDSDLLVPMLDVWGGYWHSFVFGVLGFLVTAVGGLLMATQRAFHLHRHNLLPPWAREAYFFRREIGLPITLAIGSELAILFSGLLIYALTRAAAVLVGAVFIPIIFLCLGTSYQYWIANDYDLVVWPRPSVKKDVTSSASATSGFGVGKTASMSLGYSTKKKSADGNRPGDPSDADLEQAFNMIEGLFGGTESRGVNNVPRPGSRNSPSRPSSSAWTSLPEETQPQSEVVPFDHEEHPDGEDEEERQKKEAAPEKTLKGFALPPLQLAAGTSSAPVEAIKMPPLPLKSVLRRKRQKMKPSLQSAVPLITDLRTRDTAASADQFGNKQNDVLDVNDPWAQFELTEEEEVLIRKAKKKGVAIKQVKKEPTEPWAKRIQRFVKKNPILGKIYYYTLGWMDNVKVFPENYKPDLEQGYQTTDISGVEQTEGDGNTVELFTSLDQIEGEMPEGGEGGTTARQSGESAVSPNTKMIGSKKTSQRLPQDGDEEEEVDVDKLSFQEAFFLGYLTSEEYLAVMSWYLGLFFIMLMGVTLGVTVAPPYLGNIIWISIWLLLLVLVPIVKYFKTYSWDSTMTRMYYVAGVLHFLFCLIFFVTIMRVDLGKVGTLWIFDFFLYFPVFVYIIFAAWRWTDGGFKKPEDNINRSSPSASTKASYQADTSNPFKDTIQVLQTFPSLVVAMILLVWQFYIFANITSGSALTIFLLAVILFTIYLRDWADNDHFLSPELVSLGRWMIYITLIVTFCVAAFREENPIFPLSVFFYTATVPFVLRLVGRIMSLEADSCFFFAPYLFPVYSYEPSSQDVLDESENAIAAVYVALLAILWGASMTIFYYPMHVGIACSCAVLLFSVAVAAVCISHTPRQLAKCQALVDVDIIKGAAEAAKNRANDRKLPLNLEMKDYQTNEEVDDQQQQLEGQQGPAKSLLEKLKDRSCFENCIALMADVRSLKYVKEDKQASSLALVGNAEATGGGGAPEDDDKDEYELTFYERIVVRVKSFMRDLYELLPVSRLAGYRRHNQAPFGPDDLPLEIFYTGRGPFGLLGPEGLWASCFRKLKTTQHFAWLYRPWMDQFDAQGTPLNYLKLEEDVDYPTILSRSLELDLAIDYNYREEVRCGKFLRENRFRLAANGISPPKDIFSSESYASVSIPLTAVWLSTLSIDDQTRFHTLKATFDGEQRERDRLITQSDEEALTRATAVRSWHIERDAAYRSNMQMAIAQYREQRIQLFTESLDGPDRVKFMARKDHWIAEPDCYVDMKDMEVYERYKAVCLTDTRNELLENAVFQLMEIEAAQKDIRLGEYGRAYQYVDSDFPPSDYSIGEGEVASYVLGWRCAPGIVEHMQLFDNGTHPDDLCTGVFGDDWLVSAISMLLAAGAFGKGLINDRIRFLFLPHPSNADGEPSVDTQVGAYAVRIFRNHDWIPVLVDDLLPMRKKEHWTTTNRGMASAHCKEGRGIWLSLIEKAFAKYYGSYALLQEGFVHHALEDLTGCEAECIPLHTFSQGVHRRALWQRLLRYKGNGYILGAGTGDVRLADKDLPSLGVCFNTAYTIYDVKQVDGYKLIKLRNPPGEHEEWRGDWSDRSSMWTRRLKAKLSYHDNPLDNTFFMSFDDFVSVFRYLYVCKYYNPQKWCEKKWLGFWKRPDESAVEKMDLMNQFIAEQTDNSLVSGSLNSGQQKLDGESMERKKAVARLNSAGGLPSRHNPACILENNPHYSLRIHRPTDLQITVTQCLPAGVRQKLIIQPFAILLVRNDHSEVARRITRLRREDVVASSGEPQELKSQTVFVSGLRPGLYVLLVAAYVAGMEGHFQVTLTSNYRTEFLPIWPPAWMLRESKEKRKEKERERSQLPSSLASIDRSLEDGAGLGGMTASKSNAALLSQPGMQRVGVMFRQGLKSLFGKAGEDDFDDPAELPEEEEEHDMEAGKSKP
eukprot:gene3212-3519_t